MGGQKPHLLIGVDNNLGAETDGRVRAVDEVLPRRQASPAGRGSPGCRSRCTASSRSRSHDRWRGTTFASTYSYHHGYFDGVEREFRGFGRVEQVDVESFGTFAAGNATARTSRDDLTLYQPPVKTITWYHTGAALDRERILVQFEREYFPRAVPQHGTFREKPLPEPELAARPERRRVARSAARLQGHGAAAGGLRARRRRPGRGPSPGDTPVRLFSAATHNCHIRAPAAAGRNRTPCSWSPRARRSPTTTSSTCRPARRRRRIRASPTRSTCATTSWQRAAVGRRRLRSRRAGTPAGVPAGLPDQGLIARSRQQVTSPTPRRATRRTSSSDAAVGRQRGRDPSPSAPVPCEVADLRADRPRRRGRRLLRHRRAASPRAVRGRDVSADRRAGAQPQPVARSSTTSSRRARCRSGASSTHAARCSSRTRTGSRSRSARTRSAPSARAA